jgi:tRNA pseudouridine32 synthase / 23S rRNA pseudouridine746 synthase
MSSAPLPIRDGLNPTRIILPADDGAIGRWPTALAYLLARFPGDAMRLREKVAAGEVVTGAGIAVDENTPLEVGGRLFLYRDPPADEPDVPELADLQILYRDDNLLVVDKPHFVSVLPRGMWVRNSALAYLRRELDLPELSPVHRLDRLTAGVLVFTARKEVRGKYQLLFERRKVQKEYLAVARLPTSRSVEERAARLETTESRFPLTVRSRIVKKRGTAAAMNVPGPHNAESVIDLIARDTPHSAMPSSAEKLSSDKALFRLIPHTGKTHQLRLHMASIGLPIMHDPFAEYWLPGADSRVAPPVSAAASPASITPESDSELSVGSAGSLRETTLDHPLQLLAHTLFFTDPLTAIDREFTSQRTLAEWPISDSR